MALWILAFRNLWRNPRRTFVTGIAMAIGFAGLSLFSGYVHRIDRTLAVGSIYTNHSGHVAIMKKDWIEKGLSKPRLYSLSEEEQTQIQAFFSPYQSEIAYQSPLFMGVGLISNGCRSVPFYLKGFSSELKKWTQSNAEFLRWNGDVPKQFPGKDYTYFSETDMPLMITESLARLLNKKTLYTDPASVPRATISVCNTTEGKAQLSQDPTVQLMTKTFDGGITAIDANLVGHYTLGFAFLEDMGIQGPLYLAQKLFDTKAVSRWLIYWHNSDFKENWKTVIRPLFEKQFPSLEMLFFNEERLNPFYVGTLGFLQSLTIFFVIIAGVAVALAIINSLTISIIERSKEIGTLRSLGFTESKLAWLFGREMILLTLGSLAVGLIITEFVAVAINNSNFTFNPPGAAGSVKLEIALDFQFEFYVFVALSVLVGLIAFWLAKRQIKINIAQLLVES